MILKRTKGSSFEILVMESLRERERERRFIEECVLVLYISPTGLAGVDSQKKRKFQLICIYTCLISVVEIMDPVVVVGW